MGWGPRGGGCGVRSVHQPGPCWCPRSAAGSGRASGEARGLRPVSCGRPASRAGGQGRVSCPTASTPLPAAGLGEWAWQRGEESSAGRRGPLCGLGSEVPVAGAEVWPARVSPGAVGAGCWGLAPLPPAGPPRPEGGAGLRVLHLSGVLVSRCHLTVFVWHLCCTITVG